MYISVYFTLWQCSYSRIYINVPSVSPLQALWGSSSSSLSVGESSVGEWLQRLGLERYEQGLLHNGWDDLEFLRYTHTLTLGHVHTYA